MDREALGIAAGLEMQVLSPPARPWRGLRAMAYAMRQRAAQRAVAGKRLRRPKGFLPPYFPKPA